MIRKKLQLSPINNSNSGKSQQLQSLNLEQLDQVWGSNDSEWKYVNVRRYPTY